MSILRCSLKLFFSLLCYATLAFAQASLMVSDEFSYDWRPRHIERMHAFLYLDAGVELMQLAFKLSGSGAVGMRRGLILLPLPAHSGMMKVAEGEGSFSIEGISLSTYAKRRSGGLLAFYATNFVSPLFF